MKTKEAKKRIAEEIVNMINNNIIEECGIEPFEGWCEEGEIFNDDPECISIMNKTKDAINFLSYILNPHEE